MGLSLLAAGTDRAAAADARGHALRDRGDPTREAAPRPRPLRLRLDARRRRPDRRAGVALEGCVGTLDGEGGPAGRARRVGLAAARDLAARQGVEIDYSSESD